MRPPADRPTPKANPSEASLKLASLNLPDSLAFLLSTLRKDIDELKRHNTLAFGELYRHMENWRDDTRKAAAADIETAIQQHLADRHANGADR